LCGKQERCMEVAWRYCCVEMCVVSYQGSGYVSIIHTERESCRTDLYGCRIRGTVSNVGEVGCFHTYRDRETRATYCSYILRAKSCVIGFVGVLTE
jgi:hypothetical protein